MPAPMCRFTAWISEAEREALDKLAAEDNCSVNYVVRSAVRDALRRRGHLSQLSHVTNPEPSQQERVRG